MLRNYLLTAFRHLWRHRVFSVLNIIGLTVGIAGCFLVFLYVRFELSYDDFHARKDRIYRLVTDIRTPSEIQHVATTSPPMALNIQQAFPEVEKFVRVDPGSMLFRRGDVKFQEDRLAVVDSTFFEVFDFPLLQGDPRTALTAPWNIVISQSAAKKYFGSQNPMGQHLLVTDRGFAATITGVMKDMPENTQLRMDVLLSRATLRNGDSTYDSNWADFGGFSYLLLRPGTNPKTLEQKFPAFLESRIGSDMRRARQSYALFLEPLQDAYLRSRRNAVEGGNINNVYIFSIIGIFILLIAAINFVNLTTARSTERAKEVGVRKVIGAGRGQLAGQFLGESVVLVLAAFLLSALVCFLLIPAFNGLAGKTISTGLFQHPADVLILLGIALAVGVLAGFYPALVLSAFQPIQVLKGRYAAGSKGLLLRRSLVVLQFSISIGIIVSTIVIHRQLSYMRNQDLGYNNAQTIVLDTHGDKHRPALKAGIAAVPGVRSVAYSSNPFGHAATQEFSRIQNEKGEMQTSSIDLLLVDFDFMPQYQMKMAAGRMFSRVFATDSTNAMIINESAARHFGYRSPQDAIGRKFSQWGTDGTIIGVVKDFHYLGLQQEVQPLTIQLQPDGADQLSIKVQTDHLAETIAAISKIWSRELPYRPFDYFFADDYFNRQYISENRFDRLFLYFAILAIAISCLGLLGLASYATLQRTKEIGIRKVLGASAMGIVQLLSREFLLLVLLAFLIAAPISYFLMHGWLKDFYYRITIPWWIFLLGGLLAMVIAVLTISFQAIRAAMVNPIQSLKYE